VSNTERGAIRGKAQAIGGRAAALDFRALTRHAAAGLPGEMRHSCRQILEDESSDPPPPDWVGPSPINTTNASWKVTWEIGDNHFASRLGVSMPNTSKLLTDVVRPLEPADDAVHGLRDLTSYGTP
jgi:hypothetical protein